MKNRKVLFLTQAGLIAAVYVVLTVLLQAFSFGQVQIRVAEMLTILPVFTPAAVPGLFLGCLIGNIAGGAVLPDVICGSLATLAGAFFTYKLRNRGLIIACFPPIIANILVVPFVLKYAYGMSFPIPLMMVTVGIGEVVGCGVLGVTLGKVLKRYKNVIFGSLTA